MTKSQPSPPPTPELLEPDIILGDDGEHSAIVARQAILDQHRDIFGYELFNRAPQTAQHDLYSDAALLFSVLSLTDSQAEGMGKPFFIHCTHDSLVGQHLELIHPERVVLELPPIDGHLSSEVESRALVMGDLHKRGFRFAFDHTVLSRNYASWRPLAAFVKFDMGVLQPDVIESMVRHAQLNTQARLIAAKVENNGQFERMSRCGIMLFQGHWFAKPELLKAQAIRPAQAIIIQLINLVRSEAEVAEIEDVIKKDPTLSFTLLKYINSSGFGLNNTITSFRHAVMMLGLKKLFRWAALLMTTNRAGGAPAAVGATAVVRGRLMELLAAETGTFTPEECDSAFVVGVFSLLDAMLGIPMQDAMRSLSLPQPVVDALLHHEGVYAPLLELTQACETGHEEVFARVATELKLSDRQVNWSHLQALAWAETLTE